MTWIYFSIALLLYFSLYFWSKYSRKKFNTWRKTNHMQVLKKLRNDWKEIRIKTDDCVIINFDTKVDRNSATYSLSNEDENFFEWMSRDPKRVDLVDLHTTKILCKYKESGKIKKEFSTTVHMDKTVVEFKLRLRDYISVYTSNDFDDENYFIDLEFLNEEIDFTKFK
ncbi:MAG: hypothetical protein CMP76_16155 [Flavobacterium sp.]|uniref:hypothetical protein n=1 Tax=Flavobacterium sp. TaxID=239 RepID=UPI000C3E92E7|nr:hypothetical protein [Flavobacterium sp.]MBF04815.1 hypothetical protein [Flavobacterium sp.]